MTVRVELGDKTFEAKVAENLLSRMKGMSFRKKGKMLFRFPRDTRLSIDMAFLSVPLQLVFMDSEKKVIDVQRAEPWNWDPRTWKLYSPGEPYRYLLESVETLEVEEGDELDFEI